MAHLKQLSIENFRIFKEKTTFELAPITVLTGPNNSGKSSLIKLLKLLSESFSLKNNLDELQFISGSNNLGEFNKTLSWDSGSERIIITLPFPLNYFDESFYIELHYKENKSHSGKLDYFKIFNKNNILVEFYNTPSEQDVIPNKKQLDLISDEIKSDFRNRKNSLIKNLNYKYLIKTVLNQKKKAHKRTEEQKNWDTPFGNYEDITLVKATAEDLKNDIKDQNSIFNTFHTEEYKPIIEETYVKSINDNDLLYDFYKNELKINDNAYYGEYVTKHYDKLLNVFKLINYGYGYKDFKPRNTFEWFFEVINNINSEKVIEDEYKVKLSTLGETVFKEIFIDNIKNAIKKIETKFNSIQYLSVTRGDQSRVYFEQGSHEFNAILLQFNALLQSKRKNDEVFIFINEKLKEMDIGELIIKRIENTITLVKVKLFDSGREVSLSDLGFGYSQIIPILLKIGIIAMRNRKEEQSEYGIEYAYEPSILLLEEPEANLHPNLQSKLSEIIVEAGRTFNIQFIIETHSEYIIRKLQYLTAKKQINKKDSLIYYFHRPSKIPAGEKQIKKISIRDDGLMDDDFGKGFFDESTTLTLDLLKLQNKN